MSQTKLIWVVGEDTNVGKSFISTALIQLMNARGIPTVGFKPYAGSAFRDVVDLLEDIAEGPPNRLAGRDARRIAAASPLTPEELLEVVNPSWRIHHPARSHTILIRKGSAVLGDRTFLKGQNTAVFSQREDIRELNARLQLPFEHAEVIANSSADSADALFQDRIASAYAHLQSLRPEAIVCEGAGRLLPVWEDCPAVRHLILVSQGNLYFFPNLDLQVRPPKPLTKVPTVVALIERLRRLRHISSPIPILGKRNRESGLERFLDRAVMHALKAA